MTTRETEIRVNYTISAMEASKALWAKKQGQTKDSAARERITQYIVNIDKEIAKIRNRGLEFVTK